jgi:hypothetical protein
MYYSACERQREMETAADLRLALEPQPAAMQRHEVVRDVEPETCAGYGQHARVVGADELLEQPLLNRDSNATAVGKKTLCGAKGICALIVSARTPAMR